MQFLEYHMPKYVADISEEPELAHILRIYHSIYPEDDLDISVSDDANELLDKFVDQRAFIVLDDDQMIQAITNYAELKNRDYGWIEGMAVNIKGQKIGRFMIENLVNIAKEGDRHALELKAWPNVIGFYIKQGFYRVETNSDPKHPLMRREL